MAERSQPKVQDLSSVIPLLKKGWAHIPIPRASLILARPIARSIGPARLRARLNEPTDAFAFMDVCSANFGGFFVAGSSATLALQRSNSGLRVELDAVQGCSYSLMSIIISSSR